MLVKIRDVEQKPIEEIPALTLGMHFHDGALRGSETRRHTVPRDPAAPYRACGFGPRRPSA